MRYAAVFDMAIGHCLRVRLMIASDFESTAVASIWSNDSVVTHVADHGVPINASGPVPASPVPRGAFVLARLLGQPPEPPPPNTPAVEPDVQGTTTIREQAQKRNYRFE